ncbi:MAG: hypothetical protein IPO45_17075 [Saprospiraceae bacterium]|jgi:hypothetical protein|uniref:DUF6660 family protein n=1 Tax=Candidatus Brachybacter algidus TaxID=2982024 RepID=UPI001B444E28|nr:DUF6660 family protein [Candidatus Brachybacter algidus]MBP7305302.1 hypothetical protein [Saprospiraceae bacterium]MBK6374128.1 hypothetical protein [Candidatus Brachybacter algidus]MBK6450061.1 hypothetical protein [Candidatus Brachybacter algidus]MBK7604059.1 hypothetical protein [Candidatus Brachybacter algidus]MBK8353943.1 hypothetical protein [Candidatus Brachybacter algidus]
MKLFTFIFSFYLMALAMIPCHDIYNECNDKDKSEVAANHDHQSDENDFCSPFCTCSCCNTAITDVISFYVLSHSIAPKLNETSTVSIYEFSYFSSFNGKIWQPPKSGVDC